VHSPRHLRSFAELSDEEVAAVTEAWQARTQTARAEGFAYVHALINEGAAAGSSLPHSHSQLVWLRERPPEVTRESGRDATELLHELVVAEHGDMRAVVHPAGRLPYEMLIGGEPFVLGTALLLLREVVARLRALEGPVPWNAWLHEAHLELVPRLSVLAGVELGAGIYVNTVAPEDAAAALQKG
jgi:UDPglucose--hexose-1-phosphate uridylyltransferase